jgi:5-formyltetrahydrofolate cyclo-ligase
LGVRFSTDKTALRDRLRRLRRDLAEAAPDAGTHAAEHLDVAALPPFASFSGYVVRGSEIDPLPLMRALNASGAVCALPCALDPDAPLIFRRWDAGHALEPDAAGVPAPPPGARRVRPDVVIVPLLAFDRAGWRLGQGGGFYDRTLAALRAEGPVFALGLAYAGQEVADALAEPHDQRLDAILTETAYIPVS